MVDYTRLPPDLPVPQDDGACDHLPGVAVPSVTLAATLGAPVNLAQIPGRVVLFCYPMTGRPDQPMPANWDQIPGARGCTPEAIDLRDNHAAIRHFGARLFGLSTQDPEWQAEAAERLALTYPLLSDEAEEFAGPLRLPIFTVEGMRLIRRLTLIIRDGAIEHVFYPVFPPDRSAAEIVGWLSQAAP